MMFKRPTFKQGISYLLVGLIAVVLYVSGTRDCRSEEEPQAMRGVICDTPEQAVRVANIADENNMEIRKAIEAVNTEVNKADACDFGQVLAIIDTSPVRTFTTAKGVQGEVKKVTIIGVKGPIGWVKLPQPDTQYTLFRVEGKPI